LRWHECCIEWATAHQHTSTDTGARPVPATSQVHTNLCAMFPATDAGMHQPLTCARARLDSNVLCCGVLCCPVLCAACSQPVSAVPRSSWCR
jgi:hypothetical protein